MFNPIDALLREIDALKKKVQKLEDDQIKQNRDYKDMMYNLDTDNIPALQGVVKKVNLIIGDDGKIKAQFVMDIVNNESYAKIQADRIDLTGLKLNLTTNNITISSDNFTVDANGNVTIKGDASVIGVLTAKSGSKLGPWIFEEDRISGIQGKTNQYIVRNPDPNVNKSCAMNVTADSFVIDGSRIGVKTTAQWGQEFNGVPAGAWSEADLGKHLNTTIVYMWTTGWENTISWERLAALGESGASAASVALDV